MKRWTPQEIDELKKIYSTMTAARLALHFGRSVHAIQVKCFHLGLSKGYDHARIRLSREQKAWLRVNYPHMSNEICAMHLGMSVRTLIRNARWLGIDKSPEFMRQCQACTARKAKESHLRNGTYPAKGWYSPNLRKGEPYRFKPKSNVS